MQVSRDKSICEDPGSCSHALVRQDADMGSVGAGHEPGIHPLLASPSLRIVPRTDLMLCFSEPRVQRRSAGDFVETYRT